MTATAGPSAVAPVSADQRLAGIWEAVARPDVAAVTTDVFDTLLWRLVPTPVVAFSLAGDRLARRGLLAGSLSAGGFAALREQAEIRARELLSERMQRHEVTLHEIYALLPPAVFAGGATAEHALAVELEVERDLLVPDLDVLALLQAASAAGKAVAAVSDTYFTEAQLRGLLDQPALADLKLDHVFASSAYRVGKSGGLFEIVLRELNLAPGQVVHIGDNTEADVSYPRKLGITATPFEQRPPALEELMQAERRHVSRGPVFARSASFAGVAPDLTALRGKVAARTERAGLPSAMRPYWDHGALVQGPVLTGFAEWVQEQAELLGAHRLHAFMREGAFLAPLIDRAGEYLGTDIRCEPLWLNREVLSAAAIGDASAAELAPLLVRRRPPTVGRFLRSIGLAPSALMAFTGHLDTSLDDRTTRINLLAEIEANDAARSRVVEYAAAARDRVVRYVQQVLGDDERLVCVDLGWAGSAQGLLGDALRQAGVDLEIAGLYLALHRGAARRTFEGMHVAGFLSEFGLPQEATDLLIRSPEVLEQICMPDHGSQVGISDALEPVLDEAVARDAVQSAQAATVRQGVLAFQREWGRYRLAMPQRLAALGGAPELLRPLLIRSVVAPTPAEVEAFGGWMHDENQGSDAVEPMADPAQIALLRHYAPEQLKDLPMADLYWPFAVASRIDPTWAALIDLAAAGELPWEALSGDVDTGPFEIGARGVDTPEDQTIREVPARNRFGLSAVQGTLRGGAIHELVVRPCDRPAIVRLDHLELRCHAQGRDTPDVVRFETPQDFARLARANAFVLNPNLFIAHSSGAELRIDLTQHVVGHVFRIDVRAGFATLAIGEMLPTPGRVRSPEEAGVRVEQLEHLLTELQGSLSWRVTKPLRTLKRVLGR
jgi:FMN phosphatase YigB (HAD superfamily)